MADHYDWHRKPWMRAILWILLPLMAGGLVLITTRIVVERPPTPDAFE